MLINVAYIGLGGYCITHARCIYAWLFKNMLATFDRNLVFISLAKPRINQTRIR